jgi:hypothetical protein
MEIDYLNFAGLTAGDAKAVRMAIARGENFHGYIPTEGLGFIIGNYRSLAASGMLEAAWLDAYVHASHFHTQGVSVIQAVFDACNRDRLLALKPIDRVLALARNDRLTLFRGCAGPVHTMGMSWTPWLGKAIWYAAHHAEYYELTNMAVYTAIVPVAEIYCCLEHYEDDVCIVHPCEAWRVDVPAKEFRLNRPR